MSNQDYLSLTGEVVFNHVTQADPKYNNYSITISLDKEGITTAEKEGLRTSEYKEAIQISANRSEKLSPAKVFNAERNEVDANHLSLFGDKVTILVKKKKAPYDSSVYLERIRVDEKAVNGDYDAADF